MGVVGGEGPAQGHDGPLVVGLQQLLAPVAVVELEVLLQEGQHDRLGLGVAARLQRGEKDY